MSFGVKGGLEAKIGDSVCPHQRVKKAGTKRTNNKEK
jgi:hypothetical protein